MSGEPVEGSFYVYTPNKWAPIVFIVGYAASLVGHLYQCHRHKSWSLTPLHPLCAAIFTLGYALRLYSAASPSNHLYTVNFTRNLIVYILSQVFIYVCPPLLELANYHVLGRLLYYVPWLAPLAPGRVLRVFGVLMALVELLNALGVALASNPSSSHAQQATGGHLVIAALAMQLGVIACFVGLAGVFHRRCARAGVLVGNVTAVLGALYASMALILVRCVYRLVEHMGNTTIKLDDMDSLRALSPVLRYEWWFYVFEATLMLLNSLLWNMWHPGRYLPKDHQVFLAKDGVTELVGEGSAKDERAWWMKGLNILTFGLLFGRKRAKGGFAELADISNAAPRGSGEQCLFEHERGHGRPEH